MDDPANALEDQPALRGGLTFPDAGRLALDDLLSQLVDRAHDVMASQGRLRGLLHANQMVVADISSADVLRRIVEAACELVGARFGALGVLGPHGAMEQIITVGDDHNHIDWKGHLPGGAGILGVLTVPIRVRGEVFGNLYLTEREGGHFSGEDEELAVALAASAAIAIENSRLYTEAHQRHLWLLASTEITRELLAAAESDPFRTIAARAMQVAGADQVSIVLPGDGDQLVMEVALGVAAESLAGMRLPASESLIGQCLKTGQPQAIEDIATDSRRGSDLPTYGLGPALVLPFALTQYGRERTGGLVLCRRFGGRGFLPADVEMAATFADHAAVAFQLAAARHDQQRLALLEDRGRIARDLHDHVIQRLFATGLSLEGIASKAGDTALQERLAEHVTELDETIRQIRTTIFHLQEGGTDPRSLRSRLLELADQAAKILGFDPAVVFDGPLDTLVDPPLAEDAVAVAREALSNAVRHAQARSIEVRVSATNGQFRLEVSDDGIGPGEPRTASGLANLRHRAERRNGSSALSQRIGGGSVLSWTVPLSAGTGAR